MPFIPLAAAGISGAFGLIGAHKASNAAKAQQAAISPLINAQADASKWSLDQAKIEIPKARETLGGPLAFWNKILSGDRNAAMSVAGPSADQLAAQTAAANRTQAEFSPRGGRRALMLGDQPLETMTSLNRGLLELRPRAAEESKSIGQILAQLGLGEASNATASGDSALRGQLGASNLALQSAAQSGAALREVGSSIGNILRLLTLKKGGDEEGASGGFGGGFSLPGLGTGMGQHELGHDPTFGR